MARSASKELVEILDGFLQRNAHANGANGAPPAVDPHPGFPKGALASADLPAEAVLERLAHLAESVASQVKSGEVPRIDLPDLHRANAVYDDRGHVFLGHNVRPLLFDRKNGKAFVRVLMTLEIAKANLRDGICTTKRGLFYLHRGMLPDDKDQIDTDRALASLANVLRVRRKSLKFIEARRGTVHGRLVVREREEVIDLSKLGPAGYSIPRFMDEVEIVDSNAAFIVIVEKQATASRLAQARWWDAARTILLCSEGFPSLSAREFVRMLTSALGIPAVIFADADPAGIRIALTFAHGSITTALETPWLAADTIRWAGLYPSEFDRHCGPRDRISLTETDRARASELLAHPSHTYVNDRVRKEVEILLERGFKVELDSFCDKSARLEEYLEQKLSGTDLITL